MAQSAQPTAQTIVIFGASGDLTQRKLIPSLYHLFLKGRLDIDTNIIGMAIDPFTDETFRVHLKQGYEQLVGPLPEPYQCWTLVLPGDFAHLLRNDRRTVGHAGYGSRALWLASLSS